MNAQSSTRASIATVTPVPSQRNGSTSLRRALRLLDVVAKCSATGSITLTELAADLGLSKSTVLRLATPLVEERLLRRADETGRFSLGDGVLRLGQSYLDGLDLRGVAAPTLRRLLRHTGDTCHLVVRDGLDVVYIDKVEDVSSVRMASRIGRRMPMQTTAVGKAIIAFSPPTVLESVLDSGLRPITDRSISSPDVFRAEMARTRRRGYAIDDRENEPEVRCVGAPVFDQEDIVVGALSVSALTSRMTARRVRELGPKIARMGLEISAAMGSRMAVKRLNSCSGTFAVHPIEKEGPNDEWT